MILRLKLFLGLFFYASLLLSDQSSMLIIGQRGACGYEPDNTLSSFRRALNMGVDMIELDVYECLTGEVVVSNYNELDRTTNGTGKIEHTTFNDLRMLLVDSREQIPTLNEVVELVNHQVPINIELKGFNTACAVTKVINYYLQKGWNSKDFIVSSFDHEQIGEFKKLCPTIKTAILFSRSWKEFVCPYLPDVIGQWVCTNDDSKVVATALKYQADCIGLFVSSATESLVQAAHTAGFPVFVWTVNDKKTADDMRYLQVDAMYSNYPDRVR